MPDRTIPLLSATAILLFVGYLGLMVTTISFATWQTELTREMRDTEVRIASLEGRYYDLIKTVGAEDPSTFGLVEPRAVRYVAEASRNDLSLRGE
ncbi:MAG: hypothetical protein KBC16_01565 [Candidatus Pacebacteria bacterium]|nr:hypothetical protein [Candidatus Paceibacterota bacterium]